MLSLSVLLLPLGLTKPLVEPGVDKKALANKTLSLIHILVEPPESIK